jgi:hypothetical protein
MATPSRFSVFWRRELQASSSTTVQIAVSSIPIPQDLYVDANSGSDTEGSGAQQSPYKTITKALAVVAGSSERHVIHIGSGVYNLALGESFPLACANVDLIGEGATADDVKVLGELNLASHTLLDGVRCYVRLDLSGSDITVQDVVMLAGYFEGSGAIYAAGTHILVQDCLIETGGIGASGSDITIRRNRVSPAGSCGI